MLRGFHVSLPLLPDSTTQGSHSPFPAHILLWKNHNELQCLGGPAPSEAESESSAVLQIKAAEQPFASFALSNKLKVLLS